MIFLFGFFNSMFVKVILKNMHKLGLIIGSLLLFINAKDKIRIISRLSSVLVLYLPYIRVGIA